MIIRNEADVTRAVLEVMEHTTDPRLREIMVSLIRHLHGFIRDVRLTEEEFRAATELLNETYLRLVRQKQLVWESRGHFIALASKLMRQILVEHARAKNAKKRGAGIPRIQLEDGLPVARAEAPSLTTIVALDQALERLSELDEMQSNIVEMRLFGGFTIDEVADALEVSHTTVENEMKTARLWLARELRPH